MAVTKVLTFVAGLSAALPAYCFAESSNQADVRRALEDGWKVTGTGDVVYGKMLTEGDWLQGSEAVVSSCYSENPQPFLQWLQQEVNANYAKMAPGFPGLTQQTLMNWLQQSITQHRVIQYNKLQLEAGFATYNRWQEWSHPSLDTSHWPWKYKDVQEKNPLPNWHQFYLRFRLVAAGATAARHPVRQYVERTLPYFSKNVNATVVDTVYYYDFGDNRVDMFSRTWSADGTRTYVASPKRTATVLSRGPDFLTIQPPGKAEAPLKLTNGTVYAYRNCPISPAPAGRDPRTIDWWPLAPGHFSPWP